MSPCSGTVEEQTFYRPAVFEKVGVSLQDSGIIAVFVLPWHRGFDPQYLLISYGEDWIKAHKEGKELSQWANFYDADHFFSPIPIGLPPQLRPQPQFAGVSLTVRDVQVLSHELKRVADLFANGGHAPSAYIPLGH